MRISGQAGVPIYKATPDFWVCYQNLPRKIQQLADKNFELLKQDSKHPSLHLKKVGAYWSARVGTQYRTLAFEDEGVLVWFWIGKHDEYMRLIRSP